MNCMIDILLVARVVQSKHYQSRKTVCDMKETDGWMDTSKCEPILAIAQCT